MTNLEPLDKAMADTAFLASDLRDALRGATALESLILLPLINRAAALANDLAALRGTL